MADPVDIAALVPAVQRALAAIGQTPDTDELYGITADALASVLLYTGSVFGAQLIVTERDDTTQAPSKYATDRLLTPQETAIIRAQAAMERMAFVMATTKASESISDEAQTWEVTYSAQAIRDQLKLLVSERDRAIESLMAQGAALDSYCSYIEATDAYVSIRVEPWLHGLNPPVSALGGMLDVRFPG